MERWPDPRTKRPVFNMRSEGRKFSRRCLLLASCCSKNRYPPRLREGGFFGRCSSLLGMIFSENRCHPGRREGGLFGIMLQRFPPGRSLR